MCVKEQLQNGGDVSAFSLIFLRQGKTNNCPVVQGREIKGVFFRSENFDDIRINEVIEIIVNGGYHASELLRRLPEISV